jgi:anti-sigma factor RsiW
MRCEDLRDKLIAYVDGELPESETAACDGHLAECEACADLVAERRTERDRWRTALRDDTPADLRQEILAGRPAHKTLRFDRKHTGRKSMWPAWAAAAVLAVIVLGQIITRLDVRDEPVVDIEAFTRPGGVALIIDGETIGAFEDLEEGSLEISGGFL